MPRSPLVTGQGPHTLAAVVGDNIQALRTARGWSQAQLAAALRVEGVLAWSPSTVALVETGKKRADHLLELAVLCRVFHCPLARLLAGPNDLPINADGGAVPLELIRLGLAGFATSPALSTLSDDDIARDTERLARLLSITREQFYAVLYDVYGVFSFALLRDRVARIENEDQSDARGRRGHATRQILTEMAERIDRDGLDQITERVAQSLQLQRDQAEQVEVSQRIALWIKEGGRMPTPAELGDGWTVQLDSAGARTAIKTIKTIKTINETDHPNA